jgi:hypothetical protein
MRVYERFADKGYHTSIATSFGIDFDAYENIVLPRIRGAGCRNNMVITDGRMLTYALGGASALPRQAGKLYSVAGAPSDGLFHPKLFLQLGRKGGRLLIGSANLTAPGLAGNLELVALIACGSEPDAEQRILAQAWDYLSGLIDPNDPILPAQREWMLNRTPWLRTATAAEGIEILADGSAAALLIANRTTGIAARFADQIEEGVTRLTVISPYWDERLSALSYLNERLDPKTIAALIDPETALFPQDAAGTLPNMTLYRREGFQPGRFIHAKILIAETATADHILIGSANCTLAALGSASTTGSNDEASLYRRLPPGTAIAVLGLESRLGDEQRVSPADLPSFNIEDDIPLQTLDGQRPGIFALRGSTLTWQPASAISEPERCSIDLLSTVGDPLDAQITALESANSHQRRYEIEIIDEAPAFAQVIGSQDERFAPAIITQIDTLQAAIRETHSRKTENALAQLDGETEASLALLEVLDVLEKIEDTNTETAGEGVSIPKTQKQSDDSQNQAYQTLSYKKFIAGRRPHQEGPVLHNSLGGSDVSIVRGFLNRIVGLRALIGTPEEDDEEALKASFNLVDETDDAAGDLAAGEEFDGKPKEPEPVPPDEVEHRRKAKQRRVTKEQLVTAATNFSKRIEIKQEADTLTTRDFLRLRALLMIICAASWKRTDNPKVDQAGRTALQVLATEGDTDSWPTVMGRLLFRVFGGPNPAIHSLKLDTDHDQLPADLIECWATCFWCLQACLAAPLSPAERARIDRYIAPLAELTYQRTFLSEAELMAYSVTSVIEGMSAQYAIRLGIEKRAIQEHHRTLVVKLFVKTKQQEIQSV